MENNPIPVIEVKGVRKSYANGAEVCALDDVDLTIGHGQRVAIMGQSGSGKSTLLNLICGLDVPTKGQVLFEGRDLATMSDDDRTRIRRVKMGMIFQTFNLLPTLTGVENVALPLRLNGVALREANEKALAMIEKVGITKRAHHRPDEMSGGERQRIAIARALIFDPPVLLADEPTGNLDSHTGEDILSLLESVHSEFGTTILLVTHNEHAAEHCERRVTLLDGKIVADETDTSRTANVSSV